jgi:hypothetical protein
VLPCIKKGDPHYNEKGAESGQYFSANGCPSQQLPISTILNVETISITVDDIGNTGCVGNISKTIRKTIAAHVSAVPDDPFIVLLENGVNICEGCRLYYALSLFKCACYTCPIFSR